MSSWFLMSVVAAVLLGSVGLWWFSADQRLKRKMAAVPRRAIAAVAEGELVRVSGKVEVASPITAPISGRACAYWRVVVQEQRRFGKNSGWVTVIDDHEGADFVVRDVSGRAQVCAAHARAVLEKDVKQSSGVFNAASQKFESFLQSRGYTSSGFLFAKTMAYNEGVVEHGETVHIVGVGRWEPDPDPETDRPAGFRERTMRLVLDAPEDGPLLLTDEPID